MNQKTILLSWLLLGLWGLPAPADQQHWSFRPILRPDLPQVTHSDWIKTPIDAFILERLESEQINPSPEASRETLIRRVTLDLTGLPPTPAEVTAFVNDHSGDAYDKVVDRLLASPHYGERWARPWLDLAHYADSDGYLTDQKRRFAWRYRHWLVNALNQDLPFDQFTIQQLAGDLLPEATLDQKIATGFLRQTLSNREGGADLEEYRVLQVKDRASTLGVVWLGLTVGCAQCHDHKIDPIAQREFYALYAFFNSADEVNVDAPLPGELEAFRQADAEYVKRRSDLITPHAEEIAQLQRRWELRILEAGNHSGEDAHWDRQWEILGLVWGQGLGEGQLEGQSIVRLDPANRTASQRDRLLDYFLQFGMAIDPQKFGQPPLKAISAGITKLSKDQDRPRLTRASIMAKSSRPRPTFLHKRGVFTNPGEAVEPGTPACLPALSPDMPRNRLALARWLIAPENPMTSRVAVNRMWQEFFGQGLVRTAGDFGSMGESPSHEKLLDWLAIDFTEHGWQVKRMHRQIVTSAAYRQSSRERPDLQLRDPQNKLLARQASLRITAEAVRDCTLAVSGLLATKIGGPSVRPPRPPTVLMREVEWDESQGEDRYRRGLYTIVRRTNPFPQSETFDAPTGGETCTHRERSNTPLQALMLLNDPVFFEAASALATRIVSEQPGTIQQRIDHGFRICMARRPEPSEREALVKSFDQLHEILRQEAPEISPHPIAGLDPAEAGAWTGVASVILNLHEFITRD